MTEQQRILKMVEDGKISSEEASKLLTALGKKPEVKTMSKVETRKAKDIKGKLRVKIDSADGDKVNIAIPLKLAMIAKNFIPKDAQAKLNNEDINIGEILNNIDQIIDCVDEDIVSVESADGDNIRIYIDRE